MRPTPSRSLDRSTELDSDSRVIQRGGQWSLRPRGSSPRPPRFPPLAGRAGQRLGGAPHPSPRHVASAVSTLNPKPSSKLPVGPFSTPGHLTPSAAPHTHRRLPLQISVPTPAFQLRLSPLPISRAVAARDPRLFHLRALD